jgi:hypothetical protein
MAQHFLPAIAVYSFSMWRRALMMSIHCYLLLVPALLLAVSFLGPDDEEEAVAAGVAGAPPRFIIETLLEPNGR